MITNKVVEKKLDAWFKRNPHVATMERIQYMFETEKLFENEPNAIRYGHSLDYILSKISVPVDPEMEIVGEMIMRLPTEEEKNNIVKEYTRWWNIPLEERHKQILFYYSEGWLRCRPYWFFSLGHLALDWEALINEGFAGLKKRAEDRLKNSCNKEQKEFLEGAIICYEAFSKFYKRYADEARKNNRDDIADNLEQVSEGPALTFAQALQQIWLLVMIVQKICGCGVLNYSRMDKYLRPLYEQDIKSGKLTKEHAVSLLEEFFYRNNEIMAQTDHMSLDTDTTKETLEVAFDDPNYLTLGGLNADGSSAVCELSFVMLQAAWNLKIRCPFIVVRYHEGIDKDFWKLCCDAMRDNATVVIYNDETMIPALKYFNVDSPEVYDYGFWGCNDPNIPAYEGGLRQLWMNLLKPLELALNEGDYPMQPKPENYSTDCEFSLEDRMIGLMTGPYYGLKTKPLDEIKTMDDFLEIYESQVEYLISEFRKGFEKDFAIEQKNTFGKIRIEDCFLKGTIENAVTWSEGGTKYHKIVAQGCGLSSTINALYAIEKVVFIDKKLKLSQLAEILRNNYEGHEDLHLYLKNKIDKFGNDIEAVDKYAKIVTDIFIRAIDKYNGPQYLYQMWPTYSTDRDFTLMGSFVGATPDGRMAAEALSENQSPDEGTDLSGTTAMLNSLSTVPFNRITGGPLNLKLHPSAVKGEDGLEALAALFKTYMQNGGMQLQINVLDSKILREAQKNPDKYRSLCVRVTGYSAFFVEMGKKAQDEMIKRTEHMGA